MGSAGRLQTLSDSVTDLQSVDLSYSMTISLVLPCHFNPGLDAHAAAASKSVWYGVHLSSDMGADGRSKLQWPQLEYAAG